MLNTMNAITAFPARAKAIAALAEGDTLIVTKLDRLARSTRDLLNTLDTIGKAGASFKSLGDQWAGTTTPHGSMTIISQLTTELKLIRVLTNMFVRSRCHFICCC